MVAKRFEWKVPPQDKADVRHSIMMELADAQNRKGGLPLPEAAMYRIASFEVADYWRKKKRQPDLISLDEESADNDTGLSTVLPDDSSLDLDAWVDARTFLLSCPKRLIQIAHKKVNGIALIGRDRQYLSVWRRKEQKTVFMAG
jgi:DNA-directed RNA polymerase specialized sigma24 family protein